MSEKRKFESILNAKTKEAIEKKKINFAEIVREFKPMIDVELNKSADEGKFWYAIVRGKKKNSTYEKMFEAIDKNIRFPLSKTMEETESELAAIFDTRIEVKYNIDDGYIEDSLSVTFWWSD